MARWRQPEWSDVLLLPEAWAREEGDPVDRGPFATVHCSTPELAARVAEALTLMDVEP